jgi:hypothetical protein
VCLRTGVSRGGGRRTRRQAGRHVAFTTATLSLFEASTLSDQVIVPVSWLPTDRQLLHSGGQKSPQADEGQGDICAGRDWS